jgi:hypothetical protein
MICASRACLQFRSILITAIAGAILAGVASPVRADSYEAVRESTGAYNQHETFYASFYVQVNGPPMPSWAPIEVHQREVLPHYSAVQVAPGWYKHTYKKSFGAEAGPPVFGGFQQGELYKVEYEKWDPNANNGAGGYVIVDTVEFSIN